MTHIRTRRRLPGYPPPMHRPNPDRRRYVTTGGSRPRATVHWIAFSTMDKFDADYVDTGKRERTVGNGRTTSMYDMWVRAQYKSKAPPFYREITVKYVDGGNDELSDLRFEFSQLRLRRRNNPFRLFAYHSYSMCCVWECHTAFRPDRRQRFYLIMPNGVPRRRTWARTRLIPSSSRPPTTLT